MTRALILTRLNGGRFGIVVASWEKSGSGCVVVSIGDGVEHVVETFDEIANALDALRVLEDSEAEKRTPTREPPAVDAWAARQAEMQAAAESFATWRQREHGPDHGAPTGGATAPRPGDLARLVVRQAASGTTNHGPRCGCTVCRDP